MDVDRWIEEVRRCSILEASAMKQLCDAMIECLVEEPNVLYITPPVTVCGDIHGQFFDMLHLFEVAGQLPAVRFIFLGDYVDRGRHSLETLTLLMLYKVKYPDRISLLRGNHETRQITQVYGFYDECIQKYGDASVWKYCCQVFDYLPISALIDGRILCLHGGLSPEISTIDQIRTIERAQDIPSQGPYCDLVWSDPDETVSSQWSLSPRGAGYLFGHRVASEFCQLNDLTLLVRAHQLVHEGYKFMFPDRNLVTVWSAPNYCYRCANVASVLRVDDSLEVTDESFTIFEDVPQPSGFGRNTRTPASMYFD